MKSGLRSRFWAWAALVASMLFIIWSLSLVDSVKQHMNSLVVLSGLLAIFVAFVLVMYRRDIAERKRAEEALRASEERFSKAFNSSPLPMTITTVKEGRYIDVNDAFERVSGYSREEVIGRTSIDLNIWENLEDRAKIVSKLKAHEPVRSVEAAFRAKNGEIRIGLFSAEVIDIGGEQCALGITNDITERKQAEEALRASEERFSKAFNLSPLPMTITTVKEGRFIDVNDRWLQNTGYARSEVIGRTAVDINLWESDEERHKVRRLLKEQGAIRNQEIRLRMKSGEIRVRMLSATVIELAGEPCMLSITQDITERKRAEEALRASEESYRRLVEFSPDAIAIHCDGRIVFVNSAGAKQLGLSSPEELIGKSIFEIVHPDSLGTVKERLRRVLLEGKEAPLIEEKFVRADGSVIDVEVAGIPFTYLGKPAAQVIVRDITERKSAEEALRNSEERYRALYEDNPTMYFTVDAEGTVLSVNRFGAEQLGYTVEELVGQPVLKVFYEEDKPSVVEQLARSLQNPAQIARWEFRKVRKDGSMLWVREAARVVRGADGKTVVLIVCEDITEQKEAEEERARLQAAIQNAAAEWQMTFDAIESPMLILDLDGRVRRLNRVARELSGKSYEENIGRAVETIDEGQPWQMAAEITRLIRDTHSATSHQVRDEIGAKTWDIAASLATGPSSDQRVILVARDISRMVELQESLRRSETMSAMGALVAGVAHEVRNPLFAISATLDSFEECSGDKEEHQEAIQLLRQGLNRLSELMQELLDYGKPPWADLSPGSIELTIAEAVRSCAPLAERLKVTITSRVAPAISPVLMDRGRLVQAFQNLLENAIQHSPPGAVVTVEAKEMRQDDYLWIDCKVKDCGPGFRVEDLPKIFDPFFTRRRGGTGLGLSIVQRIVEEHGGRIYPSNHPQGGAIVEVKLPPVANQ